MISFDTPMDPGESMPDLNLIEPGVLPPGMPTPVPLPASSSSNSNEMKDINYASMGVSALNAITTAIGTSRAATAQGAIESSVAQANAAVAGVQSKQALETGDIEASRQNLKTQQEVGSERAVQGASGVDVASGSSALVRAGTAGVGAIDELTIRNNAARQAWGYQTEAIQDTYKGQFATLTAKAQSQQSLMTGGLQAISGPLAIESNYLLWQRRLGGSGGNNSNGIPFPNQS